MCDSPCLSILSHCSLGCVEVSLFWLLGMWFHCTGCLLLTSSCWRKRYNSTGRDCVIVPSICTTIHIYTFSKHNLNNIDYSYFPSLYIVTSQLFYRGCQPDIYPHISCRPRYMIHHKLCAGDQRHPAIVAPQFLCIQHPVSVSSKRSRGI